MQRNVWKLNCIAGSMGSVIFLSVIVPFWQENGLTLHQIFLLQSALGFALVFSQIPTGYLSDVWGRKIVIVTGMFLLLVSMIVQALSYTFPGFMAAEVLRGFGLSFLSGTVEAMLYESMQPSAQSRTYRDLIGKQLFLRYGFEAGTSVLGGLLAVYSLRTPVALSVVPFFFGFLISLSLVDVPRTPGKRQLHRRAIIDVLALTLMRHGEIRSVMLLHSIVSASTLLIFWFTQAYQLLAGFPLGLFGVSHAVIVGCGALASRYVHVCERWISDRAMFLVICSMVALSYLFLGLVLSLGGLAFFLLARVAYGLLAPLSNDILNRMTPSHMRATALSVRASVTSLIFACLSPIAGYLADAYTLNQAILLCGSGIVIILLLQLISMNRYWNSIPHVRHHDVQPEHDAFVP